MLEKIFHLKEKGTDIKQEFIAALVVFLSMLYIIPVSSEILSAAGMPKDALATSVILITILSTLAVGIYANTPVAMSVGMGLNAYFAYGLVLGSGIAWQSALGMVFLSGVVFLILSFSRFRVWILKSIPYDLKVALCVGLGAFLATIGFKGSGFFVINNGILLLGDLGQTPTLLATLGVLLILALSALKFKAAFILGIAVISIIGFICGIANTPEAFISLPASISPIFLELDIIGALQIAFLPAILTLMITDLFDSLGTLSGIGIKSGTLQDPEDREFTKTLQVDAAASAVGSIFGVSTTTAFLESAGGVASGGRSGLVAVFVALFFCLTLFFLPLFLSIPSFAIYPVLVVVGCFMFLEIKRLDFSDTNALIASFFMIILMPLTTSITNGLAAGFLVYLLLCVLNKEWGKISGGLLLISVLSVLPFVL